MGGTLKLLSGVIFLSLAAVLTQKCNDDMLTEAIKATKKALYYLNKHQSELILDVTMGLRITLDQLQVAIETSENRVVSEHFIDQLKFIKQIGEMIAAAATVNAQANNRTYWKALGFVSQPGMYKLTHSLKTVNRELINPNPDGCKKISDIYWRPRVSDKCIAASNKNNYKDTNKQCRLPDYCLRNITYPNFKFYSLTHQVIGLALAETNGCLKDIEKFHEGGVEKLRDMLCANVLRDAESIERVNFPWILRDIFFEQIMVCGFFGYVDFLREDWLYKILKWQDPNGGFRITPGFLCTDDLESTRDTRVKRHEKVFYDGGSAHTTAVGMDALTAIIRLCIDTLPPRRKD